MIFCDCCAVAGTAGLVGQPLCGPCEAAGCAGARESCKVATEWLVTAHVRVYAGSLDAAVQVVSRILRASGVTFELPVVMVVDPDRLFETAVSPPPPPNDADPDRIFEAAVVPPVTSPALSPFSCALCIGRGIAPERDDCPRCGGDGVEPCNVCRKPAVGIAGGNALCSACLAEVRRG